MTDRFTLGTQVRFSSAFANLLDVDTDPSTIAFKIIDPAGTEFGYTFADGQVVRQEAGVYYFDLTLNSSGYWHWRWEADGAVITAHEGVVYVPPSQFDESIPMPPPSGGTGDDGKIARVQGGVYQPYAGVGTGDVLQWTGSAWVSHTLTFSDFGSISSPSFLGRLTAGSGAVEQLTEAQATSMLNVFTPLLKGLTPASGGGTVNYLRADGSWAAPVALPISGGDDYKVAFGLTGNLAFASSVKLATTGDALRFGTTPASAGLLRAPSNSSIVKARNNGNTADLGVLTTDTSDNITVGDAANTAAVQLAAKSGGFLGLFVAGTLEYSFNATQLSWNANNSVGAGFYSTSGAVATAGLFRVASNQIILSALNNAGSANIQLVATDASDNVYLGGSNSQAASLNYNVKSGGAHNLQVSAATEYTFDSTALTFNGNNAVGAGFYSGTGTVSASGLLRGANNTVLVAARNAANTADVAALAVDASNVVVLGGAGATPNAARVYTNSTANFTAAINGTDEYVFTSTALTMNGNNLVMGAGVAQFGTNFATGGAIAMANALQIAWRNAGNTANVVGLQVSSGNVLVIGDSAAVNSGVEMQVGSGTNFDLKINNTFEYRFTSTGANFFDNFVQFGTNPAGQGTIRLTASTGGGGIWFRNNGNTADISGMFSGTDDVLYLGDSTNAAGLNLRVKTGGSAQVLINNVSTFTVDASKLFLANSGAAPTTDPSGGGYMYSESGAGKWRGSSGTITTFGPAEPHCPRCDRDFALEWESKRYGKLSLCMSCVVDALIASGIPANDFVIERRVA